VGIKSRLAVEMVAKKLRHWLARLSAQTIYITRGSPWENGYRESFYGKLRNELLNGEIFYTPREARVVIEQWRQHYNRIRPHSALGYRPPARDTTVRQLTNESRIGET
jgi:putative transposase